MTSLKIISCLGLDAITKQEVLLSWDDLRELLCLDLSVPIVVDHAHDLAVEAGVLLVVYCVP